jgi:hypothetical protein
MYDLNPCSVKGDVRRSPTAGPNTPRETAAVSRDHQQQAPETLKSLCENLEDFRIPNEVPNGPILVASLR